MQPRCTQQPDYAAPCLPEVYWKPLSWGRLATTDKMLGPKGVRYRRVPLYNELVYYSYILYSQPPCIIVFVFESVVVNTELFHQNCGISVRGNIHGVAIPRPLEVAWEWSQGGHTLLVMECKAHCRRCDSHTYYGVLITPLLKACSAHQKGVCCMVPYQHT